MKLTFPLLALAASGLTACISVAPAVEDMAVDTGREAAKAVVAPIVADTVPGPAGVVLTNCIIDQATPAELLSLGTQGGTPENITLVSNILARPETVACAQAGLT